MLNMQITKNIIVLSVQKSNTRIESKNVTRKMKKAQVDYWSIIDVKQLKPQNRRNLFDEKAY
jgi:hypothetical protein